MSDAAALLVAIASAGISVWAIIEARGANKRQVQIQERLLSLESGRERERRSQAALADVRADLLRGHDPKLIIENHGPQEARDIQVTIDGKPVLEHDLVPRGIKEVRHLGRGAVATYMLATYGGIDPIISVTVTWDDGSGERRQWSSQFNLF